MKNPIEKLRKAIAIVTEKIEDDSSTEHINESLLNKIIIAEFTKTLLTKEVDEENKTGYFLVYKRIINRLIEMISSVCPDYFFAKSFASSIVEGALHQHFLKDHLKTKNTNIYSVFQKYSSEISKREFRFKRNEELLNKIKNITENSIKKFIKKYLVNNKNTFIIFIEKN